jgi:hypothetical protein
MPRLIELLPAVERFPGRHAMPLVGSAGAASLPPQSPK